MTTAPGNHGANEQPLNLFWFLPTGGDGPYLGSTIGHRPADFGYLREIAVAADRLGFGGVLLPTGNNCLDGWTLGSALAPATQTLKFLLALRPGILSPALAARQSAAFDRISNGRLLLNIVTGGLPNELGGDGLLLNHDERYQHDAEHGRHHEQQAADDVGGHETVMDACAYLVMPSRAPGIHVL